MDITETEEAQLPLPAGWYRFVQADNRNGESSMPVYRNDAGLMSEEHPYILQASANALSMPLPSGWGTKEAQLSNGNKELFYYNSASGLSMWDPPLLRQCLALLLSKSGYHKQASIILSEDDVLSPRVETLRQAYDEEKHKSTVSEAYKEFIRKKEQQQQQNILQNELPQSSYLREPRVDSMRGNLSSPAPGPTASHSNKQLKQNAVQPLLMPTNVSNPVLKPIPAGVGAQPENELNEEEVEDEHKVLPAHAKATTDVFGNLVPLASTNVHSVKFREPVDIHSSLNNSDDSDADGSESSNADVSMRAQFAVPQSNADMSSSKGDFELDQNKDNQQQRQENKPEGSVKAPTVAQVHADQWQSYWEMNKPQEAWNKPITHKLGKSKPPKTAGGVNMLQHDVKSASERIHELLVTLRVMQCQNNGVVCRIMELTEKATPEPPASSADNNTSASTVESDIEDTDNKADQQLVKCVADLAVIGAEVIAALRAHPEYILSTMSMCSSTSNGMSQIAFTILHRLLHPFSTDPTMTSLFLLQGVNYQVQEILQIKHLFPEWDPKRFAARALFVSDPNTALNWNPLAQPLPVVPSVSTETVLTCLLRTYGIRRDVTVFFRACWKPVLHGISVVTGSNIIDESRTFNNLIQMASRLLDTTFIDSVMASFPPTATALCRSLFEVGGNDAMHTYLFNFLILPNLIRILLGDHEALENEKPIRLQDVGSYSQRYYNIDQWWPVAGLDQVPYDALNTFLWVVWKLYSAAALMSQAAIEAVDSQEFFAGHPAEINISGMTSKKLHIILLRTQRKLDYACQCLLRMPLDSVGCAFLDVDQKTALSDLRTFSSHVPSKALDKRMLAVQKKPDAMVNLLVIGRHELANIFSDVGICIENKMQAAEEALHKNEQPKHLATEQEVALFSVISDFLLLNDKFGEEVGEELLVIPLPGDHLSTFVASATGTGFGEQKSNNGLEPVQYSYAIDLDLHDRYGQLANGLDLAHCYETTLLRLVQLATEKRVPRLDDLLDPQDEGWYDDIELTLDFCRESQANRTRKHTSASEVKVREATHGLHKIKNVSVHATSLPSGVLSKTSTYEGQHLETRQKGILRVDRGEDTSRLNYVKTFHDSLRFNSHERRANVGTSILAPKPQKPLVAPHGTLADNALKQAPLVHEHRQRQQNKQGNDQTDTDGLDNSRNGSLADKASLLSYGKNNSRYTKPVVKNERFMQTTLCNNISMEVRRGERADPDPKTNRHVLQQHFEGSLRTSHKGPSGSNDDRNRNGQRKANNKNSTFIDKSGVAVGASLASGREAGALPFPEHLRHKIRRDANGSQNGPEQEQAEEREEDGEEPSEVDEDEVQDLLKDYSAIFGSDGEVSRGEIGGEVDDDLQIAELAQTADEQLPETLPDNFPDQDLRDAWPFMSTREKRQSIHYLFPQGSADRFRLSNDKTFVEHATVPDTQGKNFGKATASRTAHMQPKSRKSIFNADVGGMALRDTVHHADSLRHTAADKAAKRKIAFRPGGVAGLDKSLAHQRALAKPKPTPAFVGASSQARSPPRGSFWGANPELSRAKLERLFHAGPAESESESKSALGSTAAPMTSSAPTTSGSAGGADSIDLPSDSSSEDESITEVVKATPDRSRSRLSVTAASQLSLPTAPSITAAPEISSPSTPLTPPAPPTTNPFPNAGSTPGTALQPAAAATSRRASVSGYVPGQYNQKNLRAYSPPRRASDAGAHAHDATMHDINHVAPPKHGGFGPASGPPPATMGPARSRHGSMYVGAQHLYEDKDTDGDNFVPQQGVSANRRPSLATKGAADTASARGRDSTALSAGRSSLRSPDSASRGRPKTVNFADRQGEEDMGRRDGNFDSVGTDRDSRNASASDQRKQQPKEEGTWDLPGKSEEKSQDSQAKSSIPTSPSATDWETADSFVSSSAGVQPEIIPKSFKVVGSTHTPEELLDLLTAGTTVLKHGKKGNPKMKHLSLNDNHTQFSWTEPVDKPNGNMFRKLGSMFSGKSGDEANERRIDVASIIEVRKGIQTEVLLSVKQVLDPLMCLSLVTKERTLDVTFSKTEERDLWMRALKEFLKNKRGIKFIN